jgi:hypothetical protein
MTVQSVLDEIRERPGTGEVIAVVDPATEEQLTEFKDCGPEAVIDAVARAKASFESAGLTGLVRAARWTRPRCSAHHRLSAVGMAGLSGNIPVASSTSSRTMSAWPACRPVPASTWARI